MTKRVTRRHVKEDDSTGFHWHFRILRARGSPKPDFYGTKELLLYLMTLQNSRSISQMASPYPLESGAISSINTRV